MWRPLLLAFTVVLFCSGRGALLGQDDPSQAMIESVLDRNGTCIASTRLGLYQANSADKVWHKLPIPPAMPLGGNLAQKSAASPELVYSTGRGPEWFSAMPIQGSLYLSQDGGQTWSSSSLARQVTEAFVHSDGSIYAIVYDQGLAPLPGQKESDWAFEMGADKVKHYDAEHLLVSKDLGKSWQDVTPQLPPHFGLYGIFPDPQHPDLVCVRSEEINHTSLTFFYQAEDASYQWKQIRLDAWPGDHFPASPWRWEPPGNGYHGANMPATLPNYFAYPYPRAGHHPDLPTEFLVSERSTYQFHLHQAMPIAVSTFCIEAADRFTLCDTKDVKKYWGVRIGPEGETEFNVDPEVGELSINYPDRAQRLAAYTNDREVILAPVDQTHPYRRTIDLRQFYDFAKPGRYRVQILHSDGFEGHPGGTIGTAGMDLTVVP